MLTIKLEGKHKGLFDRQSGICFMFSNAPSQIDSVNTRLEDLFFKTNFGLCDPNSRNPKNDIFKVFVVSKF